VHAVDFLVALGNQAADLLRGVGEEASRIEPEIKPIFEKRPHDGGLMVAVRGLRKAKRCHGVQVDPLLLRIEDLPKLVDENLLNERLALLGDIFKGIHHPRSAHGQVEPRSIPVQQPAGG
jgi:hypothetical protein